MKLVYSGPGKTAECIADEKAAEEHARLTEGRQYVRALRLIAMQTRFWSPEELTKAINRTADRIEKRVVDPDGQAA